MFSRLQGHFDVLVQAELELGFSVVLHFFPLGGENRTCTASTANRGSDCSSLAASGNRTNRCANAGAAGNNSGISLLRSFGLSRMGFRGNGNGFSVHGGAGEREAHTGFAGNSAGPFCRNNLSFHF